LSKTAISMLIKITFGETGMLISDSVLLQHFQIQNALERFGRKTI